MSEYCLALGCLGSAYVGYRNWESIKNVKIISRKFEKIFSCFNNLPGNYSTVKTVSKLAYQVAKQKYWDVTPVDTAIIVDDKIIISYTFKGQKYTLTLPYDTDEVFTHMSLQVLLDGLDITHQPGIPYHLSATDFKLSQCLSVVDLDTDEETILSHSERLNL